MKQVSYQELRRGVELFNRGEFFEAHEVLEDVWRAAPAGEKKFLQGLVQIAVAMHHHSTGNLVGMRSVMERGMNNVGGHVDGFCGINLTALLRSLTEWREAVENGQTPPTPRVGLLI